jgi:prepilin-type N-terminal cleavage/methylation domain-containing protein
MKRGAVAKRAGAGFTILEVIVAMLILTVGLLAVALTVPFGLAENINARRDTKYLTFIQQLSDSLLIVGSTTIGYTALSNGSALVPLPGQSSTAGGDSVTWTIAAQNATASCTSCGGCLPCPFKLVTIHQSFMNIERLAAQARVRDTFQLIIPHP